jgi:hypothetical protein
MGICFSCEDQACFAVGERNVSKGIHGSGSQAQIHGVADCNRPGIPNSEASATPLSCLRIPLQGIVEMRPIPSSSFAFPCAPCLPSVCEKKRA